MKKTVWSIMMFSTLTILSCDRKAVQGDSTSYGQQTVKEQSLTDTVSILFQGAIPQSKEKPPTSISTSYSPSQSKKSTKYDNMRGFDPTSEDDMEDDGMSRYMENYDEEGWD